MKKLFLGLSAAIAAATAAMMGYCLCRKHRSVEEEMEPDGGVIRYTTGVDSPKTVQSTEITDFNCKFSLFAIADNEIEDTTNLKNAVYTLDAVRKNNGVQGVFRWHNRYGEGENISFSTDVTFMENLQRIVVKHNFAQHNGYSYTVSGLPDMYGASLNIGYASGEILNAYDNQDNFLSLSAMRDLASLFMQKTKKT